eukprot:CAMPEP_0195296722 /NCGR_PEP_ID=MMETSP0707-20130614/20031_1 /TAXON_ID=33640 /ORGANISM="Asterionellopsis glacialis, Strain CCMP134" /LENGTH=411 /DNA_ID=CAMNT_0040358313 /DNA_START=8 /DNA_END=1243 /DNA_ORIENTATION=+
MASPKTSYPYQPPKWTKDILENLPPHGRLQLANVPTPLYQVEGYNKNKDSSILDTLTKHNIQLFVKRDDMTGGVEMGGNKLRKLEFLMADALAQKKDSIVTIGGEQSNHCRATAAVARMLGLEPHLILRTRRADQVGSSSSSNDNDNDNQVDNFGVTGNILFDRMVGSQIYTCTPGEYGRVGSEQLLKDVCALLEHKQDKLPYAIPVGGSNALGSWGYIDGVEETVGQFSKMRDSAGNFANLDHVVFACGSGGTAAGICIGMALARSKKPQVHAMGVCDTPDYFYETVAGIANDMGLVLPSFIPTEEWVRQHMIVHDSKGLGYARSTKEELEFVTQFSLETGIVLDPVYSGKALYNFFKLVEEDPDTYSGQNVLFWHTGGSLGMYDKGDDLLSTLDKISPIHRLDVYGDKE